ncbi:MAG TPA: GNAT family N-acetyltransferase [Acidimicrobiia bacterium]|nr:GNAT family N-acetyltransferase [Acidimicrobiia bacterium]
MDFVIRPARAEDVPLIAAWTTETFSWGDYVSEALPEWLDDEGSLVVVCVREDDEPVAVSRAQMLSPTEAWLSGARVHPDHRRSGMGMAMNDFGVRWAKDRGALVVRLAVEEDNEAARAQVVKAGYRLTGRWVTATAPASRGRRMPPSQRLQPAAPIDADAAWMFWSLSELARAGRDLIAKGWQWRKATRQDIDDAANASSFFQSPGGWAIAERVDDGISVGWLATTPTDAPLLILALRDLLRDERGETVRVMMPETPWSGEALAREGFEVRPILIYSKGL